MTIPIKNEQKLRTEESESSGATHELFKSRKEESEASVSLSIPIKIE